MVMLPMSAGFRKRNAEKKGNHMPPCPFIQTFFDFSSSSLERLRLRKIDKLTYSHKEG
jgi:hypothetical protein